MSPARTRAALLTVSLGLVVAACTSGNDPAPPTGPSGPASTIVAIPASADLYVGEPQRVAFGVVSHDGGFVSFGTAEIEFAYIGTAAEPTDPRPGPSATATFVPTYGSPASSGGPTVTSGSEGRGVYEASDVMFDRSGFWTATISLDVEGLGPQSAEATVVVTDDAGIPAPGDAALPTENLTVDSADVPLAAIDSRAANKGVIPDEILHEWTIARAIEEGRPALVVFATPVYCVSRFCGPVTDMIEDLAGPYADRAVFIHVEVWGDFQNQVVNDAALEWLVMPNGDLIEPWLFLIGADGVVIDRWSSLWSEADVESQLEALPPMGA
ncbi:MAG: hypothetical protein WD670_10910 [Actinomycetota bacterium]